MSRALAVGMLVFVALMALAPNHAWASDGDVAYAYLDPDENGENTALVVQAVPRTEAEINQARCVDLGPCGDGEGEEPWKDSEICDRIRSIRFDGAKGRIRLPTYYSLIFNCSSLISLDVSGLDTEGVTSMQAMFACGTLERIVGLASLDTSHVTDMSYMFWGCKSLTSLDMSGFDTSNVTNMERMFEHCDSLAYINLSNFKTSNVKNMSCMFNECGSLISLDLSRFDTCHVSNMGSMFRGCGSLTSLDLSSFNTSSVTRMDDAFSYCDKLAKVVVGLGFTGYEYSCFPVGKVGVWSPEGQGDIRIETPEGFAAVLAGATEPIAFVRVDIIPDGWSTCGSCLWKVSAGELTIRPESGNRGTLEYWEVPPWYVETGSRITSARFEGTIEALTCGGMFAQCQSLSVVDLSGLDTSKAQNMAWMFRDCYSLTSLDVSGIDTSNVTNMTGMFSGCVSLTSLDVSGFDTPRVTDMTDMFGNCRSLTSLDASSFDTSHVAGMQRMFEECVSLTSLDVSGFVTSCVTDMAVMFEGCSSLTSLDVSGFDTSRVTNMWVMFANCKSLHSLDVSSFDTSSVTDMYDMLEGTVLQEVHFGPRFSLGNDGSGLQGKWQSDVDGEIYSAEDIPNNVDATYRHLTLGSGAVTYASLDGDGTLLLSTEVPVDAVESCVITDLGYASVEEIPWNDQRDNIRKVLAEDSGCLENLDFWFYGCDSLEEVDLSGIDVSCLKSAVETFSGCPRLNVVAEPYGIAASLKDCSEMFRGCSSLEALDLSWLGTRRAKSMRRMFHGCRSLASVTLGEDFTFRGMAAQRLPGSELPDGVWLPDEEHREVDESGAVAAYASDSIPNFVAATYTRVSDDDLEGSDKKLRVISVHGEDDQGKPQLQVASTIVEGDEGAEERLEYTVADDYAGKELYIGESPRAQALKFSSGRVRWNTVVSKVYASNRNYWTASAIIGPRVKSIEPYAFESAPNIQTLYVRSSKLKKRSKVASSLAYSNVSWVWVSGMSSSNVRKVVNAFNSWAWAG